VKDLKAKVVAVTGAASGIGLEMARAFAKQGSQLVLADINAAGIEAVKAELESAGTSVRAYVVDVTRKEQVAAFCESAYRDMGRVDVLCNNAGVGWGGRFEDFPVEAWEQIVAVNLWSVIYGCHYFYPRMIAQGGGHIVNTASGAGLMPLPSMSAYCTTKFAVQGFTETLRAEAALHNIGVTSVCPGVIKTNIIATGKFFSATQNTAPDAFMKKVDGWYTKRNYTPDLVARKVVKAVRTNRGVVLVAPETFLGDLVHRLSRALSIFQATQLLRVMLRRL
jgi:NAD(P)-dependent dehydrogenase (short-subunit alcohol dehydrogenase family)